MFVQVNQWGDYVSQPFVDRSLKTTIVEFTPLERDAVVEDFQFWNLFRVNFDSHPVYRPTEEFTQWLVECNIELPSVIYCPEPDFEDWVYVLRFANETEATMFVMRWITND